jgi:mRNA interferase RelE/StbE
VRSVIYSKHAIKALRRMPANVAAVIEAKVEQYANDPASLANNVTKLQGRSGCRLRVGDWRVIFNDDGRVMFIEQVGPRGGVYD